MWEKEGAAAINLKIHRKPEVQKKSMVCHFQREKSEKVAQITCVRREGGNLNTSDKSQLLTATGLSSRSVPPESWSPPLLLQ